MEFINACSVKTRGIRENVRATSLVANLSDHVCAADSNVSRDHRIRSAFMVVIIDPVFLLSGLKASLDVLHKDPDSSLQEVFWDFSSSDHDPNFV